MFNAWRKLLYYLLVFENDESLVIGSSSTTFPSPRSRPLCCLSFPRIVHPSLQSCISVDLCVPPPPISSLLFPTQPPYPYPCRARRQRRQQHPRVTFHLTSRSIPPATRRRPETSPNAITPAPHHLLPCSHSRGVPPPPRVSGRAVATGRTLDLADSLPSTWPTKPH